MGAMCSDNESASKRKHGHWRKYLGKLATAESEVAWFYLRRTAPVLNTICVVPAQHILTSHVSLVATGALAMVQH